jgi:uncharacterized protein YecA (UPF0149 family)
MKTMQKLKKASTTTKVALTGDGQAYVKEIDEHLDRFLKDVREFDNAAWDALFDAKQRMAKMVEALAPSSKKENATWTRLAETWGAAVESGAELADVVQDRVKKISTQVTNGSK